LKPLGKGKKYLPNKYSPGTFTGLSKKLGAYRKNKWLIKRISGIIIRVRMDV
jgi:hypothetical protein